MQKRHQIPNKKYQCFISSTYDDLREERAISINAILDAGQMPAGMEYFEAGRPQKEIIEEWIDESDIAIFIIGGRYGSIDPITGNGYTEDEFNYVVNRKKPYFSIILSELYLKKKEAATLQKNLNLSIYEKDNINKYKDFLGKVRLDACVEVNSKEEIRSAIIKNLSNRMNRGELKGGWIRCSENSNIDISKMKFEDKRRILIDLIGKHLTDSAYGAEEQKIAEQCYNTFQRYERSLKKYMISMAYSIEIKLFDDYIEEYSTANKTYKLAENTKSNFLYNPWLHEGMESNTFEIENLRYNNQKIEEKYVEKNKPVYTDNPFYVKDVIKAEFPFEENRELHRVQFSTKFRMNYDRYFHEYVFKEFCQHLNLTISLHDFRTQKNGKEYMLKWELFTPYEKYDYLSQNTLEYNKNKITLNVADLLFPGNGYIITLNSAPIGTIKMGKRD